MRLACRDQIAVWIGFGNGGLGGNPRTEAGGAGRGAVVVAASMPYPFRVCDSDPCRVRYVSEPARARLRIVLAGKAIVVPIEIVGVPVGMVLLEEALRLCLCGEIRAVSIAKSKRGLRDAREGEQGNSGDRSGKAQTT